MKKIKDLIKKNPEPARGTNYVNPSQLGQYSATNQVSEGALDDYLSSRGIDTAHLSTPTKIAHSKSNAFLKWKRDHMKEDRTMHPSPTENKASKLNTATSVQKVVKTPPGPGSHHEAKGSQMTALTPEEVVYEDKKPKMTALDRFRKASDEREKKHKETEKNSGGMTAAIDRLQKHMNKEEVELHEDNLDSIAKKHGMKLKKTTYGAGMTHPTKGEVSVNRYGEWNHYPAGSKHSKAHGDSSFNFKDLDKHLSSLKEEISQGEVNKFHAKLDKLVHKSFGKRQNEEVEQIDEISKKTVKSWLKQQPVVPMKKPGMDRKAHNQRIKTRSKSWDSALDRMTGHKPTSEETEHKIGDSVTVDSKFFGKQKGKVVKVDNQSIHVQRDGKKFSEKYPHNAVVGEDVSPLLHSVHKKADAVKNKDLNKFIKGHKQGKLIPEGGDLMGDPKSAEISPADGANGGQEIAEKRRQMSKSARIIKALYKKKGVVKEDMYDHEKEDKSVTTYGKKPKFDKAEKDDSIGEKKPTAAATLTGGTTLTGEKRDDVEIDPMMRNRPGQPEVGKKDDKKDGKKEDKKKDK